MEDYITIINYHNTLLIKSLRPGDYESLILEGKMLEKQKMTMLTIC